MRFPTRISRMMSSARRFARDPKGGMPVEGVIGGSMLIVWMAATYAAFDALRQYNIVMKATYTIADLVTRETGPSATDPTRVPVNEDYIEGLNKTFDALTFSRHPTWIRVTSVFWDDVQHKNRVDWSWASGGHYQHSDATLQNRNSRIPNMARGDTIILVETFMAYEPIFNIPMVKAQWLDTIVVTRPRFAACVPWDHDPCGSGAGGPDNPDMPPVGYTDPGG